MSLRYVRYSDEQKVIRKNIKDKTSYFISDIGINYPKAAKILHGGGNIQNISMLNQERSGFIDLFSTQPPTWQSQLKPPTHQKNWFYRGIPLYSTEEDIGFLTDFLIRNENLKLSIKEPKKKSWLVTWCNNILNTVFYHVQNIHNLPAGWSQIEDIKLPLAQQYFLDPYCDNEIFQAEKENSDWQSNVANDFARWLNRQLTYKNEKFTAQVFHTKLWRALMLQKLREHGNEIKLTMSLKTGGRA